MRVTLFERDGRQHEVQQPNLPDLLATAPQNNQTVWVDMQGPSDGDIKVMHETFHFHPLAIEDTYNQIQRGRIDEFDEQLFIIVNPLTLGKGECHIRELDIFVGHNYVVTIHRKEEPVLQEFVERIANPAMHLAMTPSYLLYLLLDILINTYFPILDTIGEDIEDLEDAILAKPTPELLDQLLDLKRILRRMWQVIWPQQNVFSYLTHPELKFIDDSMVYYYRDVNDHLYKIAEIVNTFRDTLTSVMDLYISSNSNRLNIVVGRLTVYTLVIGALTVIAGFYGMNFLQTWPPFADPMGVPISMVIMGVAVIGIWLWFRGRIR